MNCGECLQKLSFYADFNVLAKLGRDEFVSMESLYKICMALNCDIGDVVGFEKEMKNR